MMTALIHSPQRNCVSPLGIPVDDLTLADALGRIVAMAKRRDGKPRLVSTLNVDFIVNALGLRSTQPTHSELLHILRNSHLVTADGFPILWLSRIVGRQLKQRVCGSDLVPALARRSSQEGLSLFLLGGAGDVGARAAAKLSADYPGLQIAGTAAPMIHTSGPELARSEAEDEKLVDLINRSGADILLLGLGNPKQELWFHRNRHRLTVPVSIGVGGTFAFIAGEVKRAPAWAQRLNLEWLFRVTQDPARLWRRYTKGLLKLTGLCLPIVWHRLREVALYRRENVPTALRWRWLQGPDRSRISLLKLPRFVRQSYLQQLLSDLRGTSGPECRLLDFSEVKCVEMAGQAALFALAEMQKQGTEQIKIMGLSPALRRQLGAARLLDLLQESAQGPLQHLALAGIGDAGLSRYEFGDNALVFLKGQVDGLALRTIGLEQSCKATETTHRCILDVRQAVLIESTAVAALLPLLEKHPVYISGASAHMQQMFAIAGCAPNIRFMSDRALLDLLVPQEKDHD